MIVKVLRIEVSIASHRLDLLSQRSCDLYGRRPFTTAFASLQLWLLAPLMCHGEQRPAAIVYRQLCLWVMIRVLPLFFFTFLLQFLECGPVCELAASLQPQEAVGD